MTIIAKAMLAHYRHLEDKAKVDMSLTLLIDAIEREQFENQAGYLVNFVPWQQLKSALEAWK